MVQIVEGFLYCIIAWLIFRHLSRITDNLGLQETYFKTIQGVAVCLVLIIVHEVIAYAIEWQVGSTYYLRSILTTFAMQVVFYYNIVQPVLEIKKRML
jgi:hypothetical protein